MIHPSYTELMEVINSDVEPGEQPVVQSRYSVVMATAKRARQIIDGAARYDPSTGLYPVFRDPVGYLCGRSPVDLRSGRTGNTSQ